MDNIWIEIIGNVGRDPEWIQPRTGALRKEMKFTVASTEYWKGPDGERRSATTWFVVHIPEFLGNGIGKHIHKGSKVLVKGKGKFSCYIPEGEKEPRLYLKINAVDLVLLDKREDSAAPTKARYEKRDERPAPTESRRVERPAHDDEDIPF